MQASSRLLKRLTHMLNFQNQEKTQPLWEYVSASDYRLPVASVTHDLKTKLIAIKRVLWRGDSEPKRHFHAKEELQALPQCQLENVAPAPKWDELATAMDVKLADWLAWEKPDNPVIAMVGAPYGGHADILTTWANRHKWTILTPPSSEQILAGNTDWLSGQLDGGGPWIFPALERAYLRHAEGLSLARDFLTRAFHGDLGRGIIGCDSWAWAYLRHVWRGREPIALTFQAFDKDRLARRFQKLADSSGNGAFVFYQSDDGRHVLPPLDGGEDSDQTSDFMELLAVHSRGLFGVAQLIWRDSLRTEPDGRMAEIKEKEIKEKEIKKLTIPDQTLWVVPWKQIAFPELPFGAGYEEAFVLHSLLLHNGLPLESLKKTLPLSSDQVMETLSRLEGNRLLIRENAIWKVAAQGYPAVRQFLLDQGYLTDQF